jgi:hypothetical protein
MNFMTALRNAPLQTLSVTVGLGQRQPVRFSRYLDLRPLTLRSAACFPSTATRLRTLCPGDYIDETFSSPASLSILRPCLAYSRILYL